MSSACNRARPSLAPQVIAICTQGLAAAGDALDMAKARRRFSQGLQKNTDAIFMPSAPLASTKRATRNTLLGASERGLFLAFSLTLPVHQTTRRYRDFWNGNGAADDVGNFFFFPL